MHHLPSCNMWYCYPTATPLSMRPPILCDHGTRQHGSLTHARARQVNCSSVFHRMHAHAQGGGLILELLNYNITDGRKASPYHASYPIQGAPTSNRFRSNCRPRVAYKSLHRDECLISYVGILVRHELHHSCLRS
jgi:hypothetical protein